MSKKETTRFFVNEAGFIEVLDFKKRTFKQALKPFLKKGWKDDPRKLAKAMHKSSDLRDAVMVIRNAYLDHFEKLSDDLLQKISQEPTEALKDSAADKKSDKLLEEAYQDMLAATVLLSDIATKSLTNWVAARLRRSRRRAAFFPHSRSYRQVQCLGCQRRHPRWASRDAASGPCS